MNAYMQRLQQLQGEKQQRNENRFSPYLNRPMTNTQAGGAPLPPEKPEEEQPPQADMNSMFGMNFQEFSNNDKRFNEMMEEYKNLAMGLGEQVKSGYMPESIAKQRLQSYVQDSAGYFQKNQPSMMDNPQMSQAIEGMLASQMQQQGGGEGQPQLEAVQDPMAAQAQAQPEGGM